MTLDRAKLEELVDSGELDTVLACFPDMQGRLVGKRVAGRFFLESAIDELHACDYLLALDMEMEPVPGYAASSWDKGYGDFALKPDLGTLRRVPWLEGTALVLCDVCDEEGGTLVPHAPRSMLKAQLARLAERGLVAKTGSELELYLFDETYESAHEKRYHGLRTAGWYVEDYHILQTTKEEPLVRAIRNGMEAAGVPVEFSKGEWGPGQEEINLRYAEALEMADRHVVYKNGAKEIAWQQGKAITFMAKWDETLAGSSCHVHSSLWSAADDRPLFADGEAEHGMSALFRQWLAGQLACAREMTWFLAPYVNSYKRFTAGSFAPTRAAWSFDNRTAGFRVLGRGAGLRVECRVPGADVNPYLAYAATVAAGLHGIENELELEPALEGNLYANEAAREVPRTLREALALLDGSAVLRAAFGDEVVEHYLHAGRWEQSEYDRRVTDWERRRNFERA
jgi:glutamine synthetase